MTGLLSSNQASVGIILFLIGLIVLQKIFDPASKRGLKKQKPPEPATLPAKEKEVEKIPCSLCEKMQKADFKNGDDEFKWLCPECGCYVLIPLAGAVAYSNGTLDDYINSKKN